MANLAPVLLALFLNLCGYYLFWTPKTTPSGYDVPLMSSVFFAFGVVVLILDSRLFPCHLRTLHWLINYVYQVRISFSSIWSRLVYIVPTLGVRDEDSSNQKFMQVSDVETSAI